MATTTPNNIPSPDSGSNYDPTVHMIALADGVQDALTERANYGTGTSTEMAAAVGRFPDGAMWYNTTDNSEYRRVGGAWVMENDTVASATLSYESGFSPTYSSNFVERRGDWVDVFGTVNAAALSSTSISDYTTVVILPPGFRPEAYSYYPTIGGGSPVMFGLRIQTDGSVQVARNGVSSASISLNARFKTDNPMPA